MAPHDRFGGIPHAFGEKPLQTGKFVGILLSLVLGIAGFLRIVDARAIIDDPVLGDGQFLALILVPVVSLCLVCLVFVETLVAGYRVVRSERPFADRLAGRTGYILIRGAEAGVAIVGVTLIFAALPQLFAESTPAPAGVGIMLMLTAVGLGILFTSFVRTLAELFVYS